MLGTYFASPSGATYFVTKLLWSIGLIHTLSSCAFPTSAPGCIAKTTVANMDFRNIEGKEMMAKVMGRALQRETSTSRERLTVGTLGRKATRMEMNPSQEVPVCFINTYFIPEKYWKYLFSKILRLEWSIYLFHVASDGLSVKRMTTVSEDYDSTSSNDSVSRNFKLLGFMCSTRVTFEPCLFSVHFGLPWWKYLVGFLLTCIHLILPMLRSYPPCCENIFSLHR